MHPYSQKARSARCLKRLPAVIAYEREWDGTDRHRGRELQKTEQEIPVVEGKCLLSNEGELQQMGERYLLKAYQAVVFDGMIK